MIDKPLAAISAIVLLIGSQLAPLLAGWGVPTELANEIASWGGATVGVIASALWYMLTHTTKLTKLASIVVAVVESSNTSATGAEKKLLAIEKLKRMIDEGDGNYFVKKILKFFVSQAIDSVVGWTKDILYTTPPKKA